MPDILVTAPVFTPNQIDGWSAVELDHVEQTEPGHEKGMGRELLARAIRIQLRSVQIMDGLQGLFGIGAATGVYLITTVVDGTSNEPIVFEGKTYRGLKNGDMLPLGPDHEPTAVFTIYLREGEMPRMLSFRIIVLRSNADIRQIASVFTQVRADERYARLAEIAKAAVTAINPAFGTASQVADELIGLVGEYLKAKPDDQLAYYQANFTNAFDDLGVGRHPPDKPTMEVDRVRFAYEINALA